MAASETDLVLERFVSEIQAAVPVVAVVSAERGGPAPSCGVASSALWPPGSSPEQAPAGIPALVPEPVRR